MEEEFDDSFLYIEEVREEDNRLPYTFFYKTIGKEQIKLTEAQQISIGKALNAAKARYIQYCLYNPAIRKLIYADFSKRLATPYMGIAKMGEDYNSAVKGHNSKVKGRVVSNVLEAYKLESSGDTAKIVSYLTTARLHSKFFFEQVAQAAMENWKDGEHAKRAKMLWAGIERRRYRLVKSVLKLLSQLAVKYSSVLSGDVITIVDIHQEAILIAYNYTLYYDYTKGYDVTKWSSFCYAMVNEALKKLVAESTRTVAIPRTIMDRYSTISRAIKEVGADDYKLIAAYSNKLLIEKKGKIKKTDVFSEHEVKQIITAVQGSQISLDTYKIEQGWTHDRPIIEQLPSEEPSPEDTTAKDNTIKMLIKTLKTVLTSDEFTAIYLKYGFEVGDSMTINEVASSWPSGCTSKVRVIKLLETAHEKLEKHKDQFNLIWDQMRSTNV